MTPLRSAASTLCRALALALLFTPIPLCAQSSTLDFGAAPETASPDARGNVILVLPFSNRSGQPALDWIGESFPDTLNQRLSSAGYFSITREDRQFALDHLGLPPDFRPTRATTIRIAQQLDAEYVVVGSYSTQGSRIAVEAQILDVNALRLSNPVKDSSELSRLFDVENALAWSIARQLNPQLPIAQQTFLAASTGVPLSAFESYIRGINANAAPERIKHLQAAVQTTPNYTAATLALGKSFYTERDYEHAAATLARIPRSDRRSLEAGFYMGLARFNMARYADAEAAFLFVASRLPLPEVINDQAVAVSRQGRDAAALFQRVVSSDPSDPDYRFNLAVALLRRRDFAGAQREANACLKLRPNDTEATQVRDAAAHSTPIASPADANATGAAAFAPLERLRRSYSEATFRQAAFQLEQMRDAHLATLPPMERADAYGQQGEVFLAQGLLPEAEQQFQHALASDPGSAAARAGLAEVREKNGDVDGARSEATLSLRDKPNVAAYLVLARLDLQRNALGESAASVKRALEINPRDSSAIGMRQALVSRGQAVP